ncbi:winged helix-turn-helix transcriptional regulator [Actinomadura flavalba]|uniref:winged helix-turn-helix transcriptional regulator n=1 Tax=Actinomadura flavalba TaxID=1120938 RepID=UPI00035D1951|nr:helix-turn-helix domain-containing protein [Actinomadura flavalba]
MALGKDYAAQDCAVARALEIVGERWTLLIVRDALYGVRRFSDFHSHLDIPRAVLSARLAALVRDGVLAKSGAEYTPTPAGLELFPVIMALGGWGLRHHARGPVQRTFVHAGCGGSLRADSSCTSCGERPPVADVEVHPGPGEPGRDDPVSVALRKPHRLLEPLRT